MGCCSVCQMEAQQLPNTRLSQTSLGEEGGDVQINLPESMPDPYALELESYTKDLLDTAEWTLADEQAHVIIKTLNQSKFSDLSPVIQLQILFGEPVNTEVAEALLLNPDARKVWDTRLADFYQLEEGPKNVFYTRLGFPFPFKNRDFVEVVARLKRGSDTCIVMYSSDEHSLESKHEHGTTHFTVIRISSEPQLSQVNIVSQFDFKLMFNQQLLVKYIVSIMGEWTKALVQMVLLNQGRVDRASD